MVFEGPLVAPGDHQDVGEACINRLLDDVLDGGLVDHGSISWTGNAAGGRQARHPVRRPGGG
jgi:hypothetical protein